MAKLIDQLEAGIVSGDWKVVCDVFKKMTGKDVAPPKLVVAPLTPPFNVATAKKTEIYKKLSELITLGPMKDYSTDDLRDLYTLNTEEALDFEEEVELSVVSATDNGDNASPNPAYTYVPKEKAHRILNGDKRKFNPTFRDFDSYNDEGKSKVERDRKAVTISVNCRKCGSHVNAHPSTVTTGITGEKIFYCPKCS